MQVTNTIKETRQIIESYRSGGAGIGFVPTMGFLHEGHVSLIRRAKAENDHVVVSIFVNPTQFAPTEDLSAYPRDIENDLRICKEAGVSLVFMPDKDEMYRQNNYTYVNVDTLGDNLCGKSRPTHFRGVCTVVAKLFNIIRPINAYFGLKDVQQGVIIKQMVADLDMEIAIHLCPTIREESGLAKSSRNSYLSEKEKDAALILYKCLTLAKEAIDGGESSAEVIKNILLEEIKKEALAKLDYLEIVDGNTLQEIEVIQEPYIIAIAVFIGKTRLIDNIIGGAL